MTTRNGPGRPRHPDVLTPAEWRVLEHLRAGRSNAEIAERLRLSTNTVRYHISNMLSKLEFESRDALARWEGRPRRFPVLAWLPKLGGATAIAAVVAVVAVLVLAAFSLARSPSGLDADTNAAALPPEPGTAAFEHTSRYRPFGPEELQRAGFTDTGRLFVVDGNPDIAAETSYRGGYAAVRFADTTFVSIDSSLPWRGGSPPEGLIYPTSSWRAATTIGDERLFLIAAVGDWSLGALTRSPIASFHRSSGEPGSVEVILQIMDGTGRDYPVVVDREGHVWILPHALSPSVVAWDTGEHLDVSGAEVLGPLTAGIGNWPNDTFCEGGTCHAIVHEAAGLLAATDGIANCEAAADGVRITVETPRYHLIYQATATNSASIVPACADAPAGPVEAGDLLAMHPSWYLSATTPEGAPLGVALDGNRMMYVGDFDAAISDCTPCRPRWQ